MKKSSSLMIFVVLPPAGEESQDSCFTCSLTYLSFSVLIFLLSSCSSCPLTSKYICNYAMSNIKSGAFNDGCFHLEHHSLAKQLEAEAAQNQTINCLLSK